MVGLVLTCQPVVMAVTASISGPLSDRIGSRAPATVGLLIVSVALFLLSRLQGSTPIFWIAACCLLAGWGSGSPCPILSAVLGAVPAQRRGVANGVLGRHAPGDGAGDRRRRGRLHHHPRRAGSLAGGHPGRAGAGLWWAAGSPCWGPASAAPGADAGRGPEPRTERRAGAVREPAPWLSICRQAHPALTAPPEAGTMEGWA